MTVIALQALRAKFSQNSSLRKLLLGTRNAFLAEDSPTDTFWGIKGKNMLGKLLMRVRDELRDGVGRDCPKSPTGIHEVLGNPTQGPWKPTEGPCVHCGKAIY